MEQKKPTEIFKKYYKEWENNPDRMKNGYEYERTYTEMMQNIEREVFQTSVEKETENTSRKCICY
ncbi:MAG: hypothetical protein GY834_04130 [Bacteroidetes bacterium]|nr:hypothetical protein [Bacteroidota bacterium]